MSSIYRIISMILGIMVLLEGMYGPYKFNTDSNSLETELAGLDKAGYSGEVPERINIVLFGLSAESEYDTNRTDGIMLVTIDNENKQLKLTSILRDTKAQIPGYRAQKINAANRLGGPYLALQTINENFNLNLQDYITVSLGQFTQIINQLGGATVYLSQKEVDYLYTVFPGYSFSEGYNHLDGAVTTWYCRIRAIDSDFYRSGRQREVMTYLSRVISGLSYGEMYNLGLSLLNSVQSTSLSIDDIALLASIPFWEYEVIENTIPDERYDYNVWGGIDSGSGEWVWTYDMAAAGQRIWNIINYRQ